MFYINFWRQIFEYKGTARVTEFLLCIFLNLVISLCIMISGILVPVSWENSVVNLSYFVLLLMLLPTISMFVRVIRSFTNKNNIK